MEVPIHSILGMPVPRPLTMVKDEVLHLLDHQQPVVVQAQGRRGNKLWPIMMLNMCGNPYYNW